MLAPASYQSDHKLGRKSRWVILSEGSENLKRQMKVTFPFFHSSFPPFNREIDQVKRGVGVGEGKRQQANMMLAH